MKQGKKLIDQQLRNLRTGVGTKASSSTPTATTDSDGQQSGAQQGRRAGSADHVDAINALFTLLEDGFPLKFRRAFPTHEDVIRAKRVWKNSLQEFSPRRVLMAGKKALDTSKFFPDLSDIRKLCRFRYDEMGLKEPLQAYYEACYSPQQTRDHHWSHIAVYLAAKESGWLTLRSEVQRVAFPIFERNYEILCNRVLEGEDLEAAIMKGLEDSRKKDITRQAHEAAVKQQRRVMKKQGIDPNDAQAARKRLLESLKR